MYRKRVQNVRAPIAGSSADEEGEGNERRHLPWRTVLATKKERNDALKELHASPLGNSAIVTHQYGIIPL